jgi:replication-associated recombination protein RarA
VLFNKQTLDRIHDRLHPSDNIVDVSLQCDRWIASSLLQKSIRRGEVELAQRAACTLHVFDRSAIWRRLVVIACEDVGVGDIDALLEIFLAAASTDLRLRCGVAPILGAVVRRLAEAVKDRSADYLACAAKDHSDLSKICDFCRRASLEQRLQFLADSSQPLAQRAVAAWFASGIKLALRSAGPGR